MYSFERWLQQSTLQVSDCLHIGKCCAATWPCSFRKALSLRALAAQFTPFCSDILPFSSAGACCAITTNFPQEPLCGAIVDGVYFICYQGFDVPPCRCTLCHRDALDAAREPQFEGRLRQGLGCLVCVRVTATQNTWVHEQCAFWSPEVGARFGVRQLRACEHASQPRPEDADSFTARLFVCPQLDSLVCVGKDRLRVRCLVCMCAIACPQCTSCSPSGCLRWVPSMCIVSETGHPSVTVPLNAVVCTCTALCGPLQGTRPKKILFFSSWVAWCVHA